MTKVRQIDRETRKSTRGRSADNVKKRAAALGGIWQYWLSRARWAPRPGTKCYMVSNQAIPEEIWPVWGIREEDWRSSKRVAHPGSHPMKTHS